jgi:hypothetical protein
MKKDKDEDLIVWVVVILASLFALGLMFGGGGVTPGVPPIFQ